MFISEASQQPFRVLRKLKNITCMFMLVCFPLFFISPDRFKKNLGNSEPGFSLRIEVAGEYYNITGESGHSEKKLPSSFYRLMKFSRKIPCSSRRILRSPMLNEHLENRKKS